MPRLLLFSKSHGKSHLKIGLEIRTKIDIEMNLFQNVRRIKVLKNKCRKSWYTPVNQNFLCCKLPWETPSLYFKTTMMHYLKKVTFITYSDVFRPQSFFLIIVQMSLGIFFVFLWHTIIVRWDQFCVNLRSTFICMKMDQNWHCTEPS